MINYFRGLKKAPLSASSPHVWILLVMFILGAIFQYPQLILRIESPSLLEFTGLTHFSVERALFLFPIVYAGMVFGMRMGIAALIISLIIHSSPCFYSLPITGQKPFWKPAASFSWGYW